MTEREEHLSELEGTLEDYCDRIYKLEDSLSGSLRKIITPTVTPGDPSYVADLINYIDNAITRLGYNLDDLHMASSGCGRVINTLAQLRKAEGDEMTEENG